MDVLVRQLDPPEAARVLLGERHESVADGRHVLPRQQAARAEHLGMGDRGAHIVGDEAGVQLVVEAGGVLEDPLVERHPFVPKAAQRAARASFALAPSPTAVSARSSALTSA